MDLRIVHDCWQNDSDPSINGHLHYPNDIDRSLNEVVVDKIRKYRDDYNNNPPNAIFFMSPITNTSGRLHSEFVCLLFLQNHRETDRFFSASGVQFAQLMYYGSLFFWCSSPPCHPVYVRRVDPSVLAFSLHHTENHI